MNSFLRKITALLPKLNKKKIPVRLVAIYFRNFLVVLMIIIAGFLLQILVQIENHYKRVKIEHNEKIQKYSYWKGVAAQYPNIPDVLFDASLSAFNAGKKGEALLYINKALIVDPLFIKAQELKKEILES